MIRKLNHYTLENFDFAPFSAYLSQYAHPLDEERARKRALGIVKDFVFGKLHLGHDAAVAEAVSHLAADRDASKRIDKIAEDDIVYSFTRDADTGEWHRFAYSREAQKTVGLTNVTRGHSRICSPQQDEGRNEGSYREEETPVTYVEPSAKTSELEEQVADYALARTKAGQIYDILNEKYTLLKMLDAPFEWRNPPLASRAYQTRHELVDALKSILEGYFSAQKFVAERLRKAEKASPPEKTHEQMLRDQLISLQLSSGIVAQYRQDFGE